MELVFDEWFVEYMVPGSGHEAEVWRLLDALERRCDTLCVRRESPFIRKFYRYNKLHQHRARPLFRRFALLMYNPKIRIVEEGEIQDVAPAIAQDVSVDDRYLVELAAVTRDRIIVTTDVALSECLHERGGFAAILLEDFAKQYLG